MKKGYLLELAALALVFLVLLGIFKVVIIESDIVDGVVVFEGKFDNEIYSLDGQWQFVSNDFVSDMRAEDVLFDDINVPAAWHNESYLGEPLPRTGYGTYRLKVTVPSISQYYALKVPHMRTSYAIVVGDDRVDSYNPVTFSDPINYEQETVIFKPNTTTFNLYVQVLNKDHARGGFTQTMYFGSPLAVHRYTGVEITLDGLLLGIVVTMFIYHVSFYFSYTHDKKILYFAVIFFLLFLAFQVTGEATLLLWFPDIPELLLIKLLYLTMVIIPYFFFMYYNSVFDFGTKKSIIVFLRTIMIVGIVAIIFTDLYTVTRLYPYFIFVVLITCLQIAIINVKAIQLKRKNSIRLLILQIAFVVGFILDIGIVPTERIFGLHFVNLLAAYFALSEAIVLAKTSRDRILEVQYVQQKELSFYKRLQKEIKLPMREVLNEISHLKPSAALDSKLNLLYYKLGELATKIGIEEDEITVTKQPFSLYFLINSIIEELRIESQFEFTCEDRSKTTVYTDAGILKLMFINIVFAYINAGFEDNMTIDISSTEHFVTLRLDCKGGEQFMYNFRKEFIYLKDVLKRIGINSYTSKEMMIFQLDRATNNDTLSTVEERVDHHKEIGIVTLESNKWTVLSTALSNDFKPVLLSHEVLIENTKLNTSLKAIIIDVSTTRSYSTIYIENIRSFYSKLEMPIFALLDYHDNYISNILYELEVNDIMLWSGDRQVLIQKLNDALENKDVTDMLLSTRTQLLEAQIRPHFVNNTLNAIASLIQSRPDEAEELTVAFAQYLRYKLKFFKPNQSVLLSEEIDLVTLYSDIEKVRYGDRLSITISNNVGEVYIQPLLIQPLVENAIKHNLEKSSKHLLIEVEVKQSGDYYLVSVVDNGLGFLYEEEIIGVGLSNVKSRIKYFYGEELLINSTLEIGTEVTFKFKE